MSFIFGQSPSFQTYINPVIPGDHPDATLTRIGNDFYTTGSSFNVTPVIYHSTDLVHWQAIAQPVSAAWSNYGDQAGGGCWGGQMVYYNGEYWHFFSRQNTMYYVKASAPEGPWSMPVKINNPSTLPYGLGYDNSIFIDDDHKWYLVVKNGQPNNGIVELGNDGQPTGVVYNLNWLNPGPDYPYSWAEGPVMWKYNGYYYYSFARDLGGGQKVMRSRTLTADQSAWEMLGDFFNENDPQKSSSLFTSPNHASAAVMLDDSTSWVIHPLYAKGEWKGQGRQGLLNQVHYDANGKPVADYPVNKPFTAPKLPSSGIPWMVPHSDFFTSSELHPEWSFLGYTPAVKYSLTDRPGWLRLSPKNKALANTVIKNDGEHNYSLITRLDFNAQSTTDQAGLWIMRGDQTMEVKLVSTLSTEGLKVITYSFKSTIYETENTIGDTLWLKLVRINHKISGYFSGDGFDWIEIGSPIDISEIDSYSDFSTFTGTRQGLYVKGMSDAWFDFYIYRDAYTPIMAECPANQFGTALVLNKYPPNSLGKIHNDDWALYAGVEFGNTEYAKNCDSLKITASCLIAGSAVEVYLDSIDVNTKIAVCAIDTTGSWTNFRTFTTDLLKPISGNHDVYLKFVGSGSGELFRLQSFQFITNSKPTAINSRPENNLPRSFYLGQNYPNPFNPVTRIKYSVPKAGYLTIKVYDVMGREVATVFDGVQQAGNYTAILDGSNLTSGIYFYKMETNGFVETKKLVLLK
ncbi:MAG TPA: family 43 glycosylhydrolase [Candidatus Marinimicrobia bacterium]|nr:family 43 glycosylhydrolase [Candidatus Neomarinimicrobiota bacterium]